MIKNSFEKYGFELRKIGNDNATVVSYTLQSAARNKEFTFLWLAQSDIQQYLRWSIHKFMAVVLNGASLESKVYDISSLEEFVNRHYVILSPTEKLNRIIEYITAFTVYDGQTIKIDGPDEDDVVQMYFTNSGEWWFYFESAITQGLVRAVATDEVVNELFDETPIMEYGLTVEGLTRLIQVTEGKASNHCFVAMAFDKELNIIYTNAIEAAIVETGFIPIRIDHTHVPSDKTVTDEIIANIKKAKFVVADFTNHKDGVYFEAGYALGKGRKVIYSCKEDHISKAHFDIKVYQHILWNDAIDFKKKLIDKIEAYIKD